MDNNTKNINISILLILVFVVLAVVLFFLLDSRKKHNQQQQLQLITERYQLAYNTVYGQHKQLAETIHSGIMERYDIQGYYQKLFSANKEQRDRLRADLLSRVSPRYQALKKKVRLRQLHFHLANNESFLRFHRPERFGDNLTDIRATVRYVNKEHRPIDGFEEGKIYNGFRFVFPITGADQSHLGSMEISFGPEALTSAMMTQHVVLSNFLIKEAISKDKVFADELGRNYSKSPYNDYLFDKNVLAALKNVSRQNLKNLRASKATTDRAFANAHSGRAMSLYDSMLDIVITTIPVVNPVSHEMAAFLTVRSRSDFFQQTILHFRVVFSLSLVLLVMILAFFNLQYSKKKILECNAEQLQKQRQQLLDAQNIANLGHWDLNLKSKRLSWSEQIFRIFGLQPEDFAGTYEAFLERVHPDDHDFVNISYRNSVDNRQPYDIQHRILTKDGTRKWVREICVNEYDQAGMPLRSLGIIHDITSQKEVELQLVAAKEVAEAANQAKSVFLSKMSHELRTPLNAILGYTQLFGGDTSLSASQQRGIQTIHQSGEHLLMLINDILDLSKIEAGMMGLVVTKFKLPLFVLGIANIIRVRSSNKGIDFCYESEENLPLVIEADELRLRQVILNLLSNAVKFTRHGSCVLQVQCQAMAGERVALTFTVEDSGVGIAAEVQDKVFEPFQQTGEKLLYAEGSGLGLAISSELVQLMGGGLQLISPLNEQPKAGEGVGSRFFFTIEVPVFLDTVSAGLVEYKVTGFSAADQIHAEKKILIVDDNASNRAVLRDTLEPLGFIVMEAGDGSEVLEACVQMQPDAILMDLYMPEMDGCTATAQLKAHDDFSQIPVIAVTASADDEKKIRQRCVQYDFSGYITKPFSTVLLLATLAEQLHLELHYAAETGKSVVEGKIIAPPQEFLQELLPLVLSGDIIAVSTQAERLATLDSGKYKIFAQRLSRLAGDFQLMKVEQLIGIYLKDLKNGG